MTDTLLFEHFATLATAPDGIARLRELILQFAVRGKLGTQDAGDEPAGKLSCKILEEKKRLIKKGEISKSRALPKIESEEIPFQVPKNWIWLRLEDIGYNCGQKVPDKIFTYIDVTAINKEKGLIGDDVNVLQPNEAPSRARKLVKNGTVIYSTVRPYLLNIAIVDKDFNPEPIVSTAFAVVHPFEGISNRYLFYYLRSKPFVEYVESQMTGMAYPAINDQKFHVGLIPVPPTAEQHRIVAKVDRLMALCDELEARQQQERAGCLKLGTASLASLQNAESPVAFERQWAQVFTAFTLICDCPENIEILRQTILNLAVQGRLTEGWHETGILKRWKSVTLNQVTRCRLGKMLDKAKNQGMLTPYLRNTNVRWFGFDLSDIKNIKATDNEREELSLQHGDVLICEGGEPGRCAIWKGPEKKYIFQKALHRVRVGDQLLPEWLCFCLKDAMNSGRLSEQFTGSTIKHLTGVSLKQFLFPLPPLAEQHRIVAKVDALMALCDALELRLKERATIQSKFADAVVKSIGLGVI
ncbi:MAG: restriction endonuclease subunit S [Methanoregula sp.]